MDRYELFRVLSGFGADFSEDMKAVWSGISSGVDYVDSRDCGLVDAVQSGWYLGESGELFKGFPIDRADSVLDFGCGGGGATMFCAERGAHVVFVDAVAEKIDSLRERVSRSKARSFEGYVTAEPAIPISDQSMSRVICLEVLEHVAAPEVLLNELVRVGRPGALYLLSVPDPVGEKIQKEFAPPFYFEEPNHIHIFERTEFNDLVESSGLRIVDKCYTGFFWVMWMSVYWMLVKSRRVDLEGEALDLVNPPYPLLLNDWARLWHSVISLPEAASLKKALDGLLPKSQIIVACKEGDGFHESAYR